MIAAAVALAVCGSFVMASTAAGDYHLTKISEISGDSGGGNSNYVELQMYSPGQTQIVGHDMVCYDAAGAVTDTLQITPSGPPTLNGGNQRTIVVGDSNVLGDRDVSANLNCLAQGSNGAAGAVCFDTIDCVSWGGANFTGAASLPDKAKPFGGPLPFETALKRKTSRGCPGVLEASDDTNNTAADFVGAPRDPTRNSVAPGVRVGNAGANVLRGTPGKDVIAGLGGNDIIRGRGGKDVLCGGKGRDTLVGGGGRDKLFGQAGRDTCKGGPKRDIAKSCEIRRTI